MLEVKDVFKDYEGKPLLKGVSFIVEQGETVCLLGASGSGKSTLLRIISGLEQPESGKIRWNNSDLSNIPPYQRRFGLMFQDYALFPHRTVFQNIAFGLRMQNLPVEEIQERTKAALDTINMLEFSDRRVTDLSGGEQQRVALARALAPEPHLLMLDEPLGALDRSLREQLSKELRRILHETDLPAIYVTHDQEEAFAIADRLLVLHDGKIIQSGTPEAIFHQPDSAWVAEFFGLGNLVRGIVINSSPLVLHTSLSDFQAVCSGQVPEVGEERTLLLRPSTAIINNSPKETLNCVKGRVTDSVFQGDAYRLSLAVENDTILMVQSMVDYPKHTSLQVRFAPEQVLCLAN